MSHSHKTSRLSETLLRLQRRYFIWILLAGVVLSALCFKPALKLLTTVATELIHLLPDHYPSVHQTDKMRQKFNRRSSLFVIVNSPNPEVNEAVIKDLKPYLELLQNKADPTYDVDYAEIEKKGYDFLDKNKLLLVELADLYRIRDKVKDRIQKEKLGALYIDLEADTGEKTDTGEDLDSLVQDYKVKYTQGVQSRYRRSEDGTVYVVDVYPKNADSGLSFFKEFGRRVDEHLKKFDFSKYGDEVEYGFAGAIKTRVDQYDALMQDLARGGILSSSSIFLVLYLYFSRLLKRQRRGLAGFLHIALLRIIPVFFVFIPMVFSLLMSFAFCSLFFDKLNVVTSFLFAIIMGLGVDIGIHLVTRYIQDTTKGHSIDEVHRAIVTRTGKTAATSVLTTVASFYILVVNDFKGFSDFGWIAGNGLIIALLCYLLFQPCLVLLVDRFHLFGKGLARSVALDPGRRQRLPYVSYVLGFLIFCTVVAGVSLRGVEFEWDFGKLKMKIAEREEQKSRLKTTLGRVNSPAAYILSSATEARELGRLLRIRKEADKVSPTIHYFYSYYDLIPYDQDEKLVLLQEIDTLLKDDALNALKKDERELVDEMRESIAQTKRIRPEDIPPEIEEAFWGNTGDRSTHVAYVQPLPNMELDNGRLARQFYDDVGEMEVFGRKYFAVSDTIVFAQVLTTLFEDSRLAIALSAIVLTILIWLHYRDVFRSSLVLVSLFLGIFWMFGLMGLVNWVCGLWGIYGLKLNFYNMIVIPAMIGMGEDNSVHVVDRYEEFGRIRMMDVLRTSGGAAFMATLTTILGYAGLCLARHPGLNSIGWFSIIGMATCLVSSLILLPALCQLFLKPRAVSTAPEAVKTVE